MYQDEDDDDHGPALRDDDRGTHGRVETQATVTCPHCAEEFELSLDPAGGGEQEYVEDCEVCCRACRVHVTWDEDGAAEVELEEV
jgi:hypothetical protein